MMCHIVHMIWQSTPDVPAKTRASETRSAGAKTAALVLLLDMPPVVLCVALLPCCAIAPPPMSLACGRRRRRHLHPERQDELRALPAAAAGTWLRGALQVVVGKARLQMLVRLLVGLQRRA
jgi:hypothetical protein